MSLTAHYYCMACGLLLPQSARSPTSSTRLKCPHCSCEMELPSIPATPTLPPIASSPATPGASSSSSIFSYAEGATDDPHAASTDPKALLSPEHSKSKKDEEGDSEGEDEGENSETRDNSRSRRSKKGKKRDPMAPKRASNAYMLFCKEQRPLLKVRQPELHFSNIGQILGEMWRTLPLEEKKPYEERAADDRDRYKAQMQHYNVSAFRHGAPPGLLEDAFSAHSSPSLQPLTPQHAPFQFPLSSTASSSSSSPFATYPPGARYQPYPTHGGGYSGMSPQSSSSAMSSPSYSSIKRGRGSLDRGPLDRASMSEAEYYARLYHFQKQQQEMINEDIRRYGKQRPSYSPMPGMSQLPPLHSGQPTMSDFAGGGQMPAMMGRGMPPPHYAREESLASDYQLAMGHHTTMPIPFGAAEMDSGLMDDPPDLDFGSHTAPRHPFQGWEYDTHAMQ